MVLKKLMQFSYDDPLRMHNFVTKVNISNKMIMTQK